METPSLSNLEGLTDVGLRGGVDMRPTLLRVLTDLYAQKLAHTADEERHYTELALRLLDSVDVETRSTIAARLARQLSPPARVMQRLAADLPEVASALQQDRFAQTRATAATEPVGAELPGAFPTHREPTAESVRVGADIAGELNELFFAANADERRLILLNLDIVAVAPAGRSELARDPTTGRRLEAAALARRREEFARELADSLLISRELAQRIAGDELGEPIVVAAKALAIPRDLLYRILLFVNTAVGHSVERVHALATLYDEMRLRAALDLVGVWQALSDDGARRDTAGHRPLPADDKARADVKAPTQRVPAPAPNVQRREAS